MNAPNPSPLHRLIVDDSGLPSAVMDIGQMRTDSITLAAELAANCHNLDALTAVSEHWLNKAGVDALGYIAAGALRILTSLAVDPMLHNLEKSQSEKLAEIAVHFQERL